MTDQTVSERTCALARALQEAMDGEAELFCRLGREVETLREAVQARSWGAGLSISQAIEHSSVSIEEADARRDAAFVLLREHLAMPRETAFSAILPGLPDGVREELEESWRRLRASLVRLKTGTSRMRYQAEALAGTLNRVLDLVVPYRKGKIYSRRGTPTSVSGALIINREL